MNNMATLIVIAIVGGIAVAFQGQFMGVMDKHIGTRESVLLTYGLGGVLMLLYVILSPGSFQLAAVRQVPWYVLTSGILGLIIVASIGYTIPRLGLAAAFMVVVSTQFIVSAVIEHFGLMGADIQPLDIKRLAGFTSVILGVWLILK